MLRYFFIVYMLCAACKQPANEASVGTDTSTTPNKLVSSLHKLSATPQSVRFQNSLPVNNDGGHIQGIQPYMQDENEYIIVAGSSATESYYAVIKIGEESEVLSVNPILQKPFKHAGGFQIHQNLMAIGIEDNEARDVSKVYVYEIEDILSPPEKPKKIIERRGNYERATAGCVGITTYQEHILIMVGDWDSRHLDFYACPLKAWRNDQTQFEQLTSITVSEISKEDWVDTHWHAYQNINLINWKGSLYMVGLGANKEGENVADLFQIGETDLKEFYLKKIATQTFEKNNETSFRWAAGIALNPAMGIEHILSCTAHIDEHSLINEYRHQDFLKK